MKHDDRKQRPRWRSPWFRPARMRLDGTAQRHETRRAGRGVRHRREQGYRSAVREDRRAAPSGAQPDVRRLAAGTDAAPAWVKPAEIGKLSDRSHAQSESPGFPTSSQSQAIPVGLGLCDTAASPRRGEPPTVTAIAGALSGGRARPMTSSQALLATHRGVTYLVWNGQRSRIDPRIALSPSIWVSIPGRCDPSEAVRCAV